MLYPSIIGEPKKMWHFNVPTAKGIREVPLFIRTVNLGHNFLGNGWKVFLGEISAILDEIINTISYLNMNT
ncbi:hypothetical protein [Thermococcus sp.]